MPDTEFMLSILNITEEGYEGDLPAATKARGSWDGPVPAWLYAFLGCESLLRSH